MDNKGVNMNIKKILEEHKKWLNNNGGQRADLQRAYLQRAYLRGADLRGVDLRGADLQGADLQGADLQRADLRGAYLRGAYLRRADLQRADLRGAYLRGAYLQRADLRGTDLQRADLRDADLRGVDLRGVDLRGADLQGADLQRADLRDADLRGAYLRDADLRGVDLRGAGIDYSFKKKIISNRFLMNKMFQYTKKHWIVYKSFGETYKIPKKWDIKINNIIKQRIDTNRWNMCSYGINVATLEWCERNCMKKIYKLYVPKTSEVCVPYWTDGKVRVSEAKIIKEINE